MNTGDWKKVVGTVAPMAATLLGTPLLGTAVKILSEALLGRPDGTEADLAAAVAQGLTPEQVVALKQADVRVKELDLQEITAAITDTADARHVGSGNRGIFWLGIAVLVTFAMVMAGSLYGAYQLLTGGLAVKDVGMVAAVFGFLGTVVGYVAANAQQVVAYFFGSSVGSKQKTDAMAFSFSRLGR